MGETERRWFVRASESADEAGPYDFATLERWTASGRITKQATARCDGSTETTTVGDVLADAARTAAKKRERRRKKDAREAEAVARDAEALGIRPGGGADRSPLFWIGIGFLVFGVGGLVVARLWLSASGAVPFIVFGAFVAYGIRMLVRARRSA